MKGVMAVIDFETTGMQPTLGDRATEVGIVLLEGGKVVDRFQSLMRTDVRIPPFVAQLTGITNAMLSTAPDASEVMQDAARFVGDAPMVAHNAAFDSRFWQHELGRLALPASQPFVCTVLLSRRVYPEAPSHKLGNIVAHLGLPQAERAHRALADAQMTAELLLRMQTDLCRRHGMSRVDHALLMQVQRCPKAKVSALLNRLI